MKRYLIILIFAVVGIMVLAITALPQEKQKTMNIDKNQMQIMQILRDTSSVNNIMDRIASDSELRIKVMGKIINRVHGNNSDIMQICKMVMDDNEMHSIMIKMMSKD